MSYNETLERQFLHSIPQQGKVEWIGTCPKRLLEVDSVIEVTANPDTGLKVITLRSLLLVSAKSR